MVLSMDRWVGKVAVVTGASSGIGAGIVDQLVEDGLIVIGVARRLELVEKRAKELSGKKGKLLPLKADFSKEEDILAAFKWIEANAGPVHILVNNAGNMQQDSLTDGATENWRKMFDLNVLGLCIATREAIKSMKKNKIDGHIVHINSLAGHYVPNFPGMSVYAASKHAVTALTETLRQEFNRENLKIKITSVSPGGTENDLVKNSEGLTEEMKEIMKKMNVLKPEDIGDAVKYALSTAQHVQVHEITVRAVNDGIN